MDLSAEEEEGLQLNYGLFKEPPTRCNWESVTKLCHLPFLSEQGLAELPEDLSIKPDVTLADWEDLLDKPLVMNMPQPKASAHPAAEGSAAAGSGTGQARQFAGQPASKAAGRRVEHEVAESDVGTTEGEEFFESVAEGIRSQASTPDLDQGTRGRETQARVPPLPTAGDAEWHAIIRDSDSDSTSRRSSSTDVYSQAEVEPATIANRGGLDLPSRGASAAASVSGASDAVSEGSPLGSNAWEEGQDEAARRPAPADMEPCADVASTYDLPWSDSDFDDMSTHSSLYGDYMPAACHPDWQREHGAGGELHAAAADTAAASAKHAWDMRQMVLTREMEYLAVLLRNHEAARRYVRDMYNQGDLLFQDTQYDVPQSYCGMPMLRLAYQSFDCCVRPALLGCAFIRCIRERQYVKLTDLEEAWSSTKPLHDVINQLQLFPDCGDLEGAMRASVGSLMRKGQGELQKAVQMLHGAPGFSAEAQAGLTDLRSRMQLDLCADTLRSLLGLGASVTLWEQWFQQNDSGPDAEASISTYKEFLAQQVYSGLSYMHSWHRLTKSQFEVVTAYITNCLPNMSSGNSSSHLGEIPDVGMEELDGTQRAWMHCLLQLPMRALERLHAFVCVFLAHVMGGRPSYSSVEHRFLLVNALALGAVLPSEQLEQLAEEEDEGKGESGNDDMDKAAKLKTWKVCLTPHGVQCAIGNAKGAAEIAPMEQLVTNFSFFATGLEVTGGYGGGGVAASRDTAAQASTAAPQGASARQGGKAGKRPGAGAASGTNSSGAEAGRGSIDVAAVSGSGAAALRLLPDHRSWVAPKADFHGILEACRQYLRLAQGCDVILHVMRHLQMTLEGMKQVLACGLSGFTQQAHAHEEVNEHADVEHVEMFADRLLQVYHAQLALMWQAHRATEVATAFCEATRRLCATTLEREAHDALKQAWDGGHPPLWRGRESTEAELLRLVDQKKGAAEVMEDNVDSALAAADADIGTWLATTPTVLQALTKPAEKLEALRDEWSRLRQEFSAAGDVAIEDVEMPFAQVVADKLQTVGSAMLRLANCPATRQLFERAAEKIDELRVVQAESLYAVQQLMGILWGPLGGISCPVDGLVRLMLAHVLPAQWKLAVDKARDAERQAHIDKLLEEDEERVEASAPGQGKKKKKKKKASKGGGVGQAAVAAQPAEAAGTSGAAAKAPEEEEEEEEEEAVIGAEFDDLALLGLARQQQRAPESQQQQRRQSRPMLAQGTVAAIAEAPVTAAEREQAYQRMLKEWAEAEQESKRQLQAAPRRATASSSSSSYATAGSQPERPAGSGSAASTPVTSRPSSAAKAASAEVVRSSTARSTAEHSLAAPAAQPPAEGRREQHSLEALLAASAAFDWSTVEGADVERNWDGAAAHRQQQQQQASWESAAAARRGGHQAAPASGMQLDCPPSQSAAADGKVATEEGQHQPGGKQHVQQAQQGKQQGKQGKQQPKIDPSKPRVVGWDGTWMCKCGKKHDVLDPCSSCSTLQPCRNHLKKGCAFAQTCKFPHPQFALEPPEGPPSGMRMREVLVANPKALPADKQAVRDDFEWRVRVVTFTGDWVCLCERRHSMQHGCDKCGYSGPCRDWLRGICKLPGCRFPHPPFDLPPGPMPPADQRVVNLKADSPRWTGSPSGDRLAQHKSEAATAGRRRTAGGVQDSAASGLRSQSRQALLETVPPKVVKALAGQLGVEVGDLEALLPADELALALEQMQQQMAEEEQLRDRRDSQQQQQQQQQQVAPLVESGGTREPRASAVPAALGQQQQTASSQACGSAVFSPLRVINTAGHWVCSCGVTNVGTRNVCTGGCRQLAPCKKWLRGRCTKTSCQYPHPPFDPAGDWGPKQDMRAELWEGAPRWSPVPPLPPPPPPQQPQQQLPPQSSGWNPMGLSGGPAVVAAALQAYPGQLCALRPPDASGMAAAAAGWGVAAAAAANGASETGENEEVVELLRIMGVSDGGAAPGRAEGANGLGSSLAAPGLQNETGEYNCFLNVIIQCLWRCTVFRSQIMSWGPETCSRDRVVAALYCLFRDILAEEAQRQQGGLLTGTGARRVPINPSELRQALSALPGQQYRVGEMNDAAEVLLSLYERTMEVSPDAKLMVDAIFGLPVREGVPCGTCGKTTHQQEYTQYYYNTQAAALQHARNFPGARTMGQLFRQLELQHQKSCDEDLGGCGAKNSVEYSLQHLPHVFTLQLAWESHREEPESIAATLAAIDAQVDLAEFYSGVGLGTVRYELRSMVCYYGAHYSAFVWAEDLQAWLMFDDANVSRVGSWADVRHKCEAGRIQPSVLFYEAAILGN